MTSSTPSPELPATPRRSRALLWIPALLGLLFVGAASCGSEPVPPTLDELMRLDSRIRAHIAECSFTLAYDKDTSDMIPVLVSNLATGQRDPLHRAWSELAKIGAAAVPALNRRYDKSSAQAFEQGILENVLAACTLMDGPYAIDILRKAASHPKEGVRVKAIKGLGKHGSAEDYDLIQRFLPLASSNKMQEELCLSLFALDPERFCDTFVGWIEAGERTGVWKYLVPIVCDPKRPTTVARMKAAATGINLEILPFLIAPSARDGDFKSLTTLRSWLIDEHPPKRQMAMTAFALVGMGLEAEAVLADDLSPAMRAFAAGIVEGAWDDDPERAFVALTLGLADRDLDVRSGCMQYLARHGVESVVSEALKLVEEGARQRTAGMLVLKMAFANIPGSAERTYEHLVRLLEERRGNSMAERSALMQALSQVPMRAAAQAMYGYANSIEGEIKGWPAFRWCTHQISNTGEAGSYYLMEQLPALEDPFRRLDVISAASQIDTDATREFLRSIVLGDHNPYEVLYAADRLVNLGPSEDVAPFLKRAYLGTTDAITRPGLRCIMWKWYGGEN